MKSTSNKVLVNNFKHMAGLGAKFFECFNFCRISLRHSAANSVLSVRYQAGLAVGDILVAVFYGLGKCVVAGRDVLTQRFCNSLNLHSLFR